MIALAAMILGFAALVQRSTPDLSRWHTVTLHEEFEADRARDGFNWDDYLALEDRLFTELDERIVRPSAEDANPAWNRYAPGGRNNPETFPVNWNRSVELPVDGPTGGALLIHGLTDSPYSLRRTAEILHGRGLQSSACGCRGTVRRPSRSARRRSRTGGRR